MGVVDIAMELIRINTEGPPGNEEPCARYIRDLMEDMGLLAEVQGVAPNRANAIGKLGVGKGPGLLLSGHIDVVPAGDLERWTVTGPFDPVVKEGKLYGRGAADMKGPDACILQAVKNLYGERFKRQLTLVFTAGEEFAGFDGARKVMEEGKVTPGEARYGIVGEPTELKLIRAHKGTAGFSITFWGRSAHGSTPHLGVNAVEKAVDFILALRRLKEDLAQTRDELLGITTMSLNLIKGGVKSNIVPESCSITIDCRRIPQQPTEMIYGRVKELIQALAEKDKEFKATFKPRPGFPPLYIPAESEIVKVLEEMIGEKAIGIAYMTEAVVYTEGGIPTVVLGPGSIAQAHTANEFITLKQLERGVKIYEDIIRRFCL